MEKIYYDLCIYHDSCADGFGAAWVIYDLYQEEDVNTEFVPAQHGDYPPDVTGRNVIIVDFSYPRGVLNGMNEKAKNLLVLDHHKTAEDDLKDLSFARFDMDKSGAIMTWDHFHPSPAPLLLHYIQDRDLWRWSMDRSKEVSAALRSMDMSFKEWDNLIKWGQTGIDGLKSDGNAILRYQNQQVKFAASHAAPTMIGEYRVLCVNATMLVSEIGQELASRKDMPFGAVYFDTEDKRVYSLRSANHGIDVSEVAKSFGGGGHKHAAGFTVEKPNANFA